MSKVKVKTLIGSVVTVAFFLTAIVGFLFYTFPEKVTLVTGFGPYDGLRIFAFCAVLVTTLILLGWIVEKVFDFAGKSGLYFHWGQNKDQIVSPVTQIIAGEEDENELVFSAEQLQVFLLPQATPGHLEYAIEAELKGLGLVRYGTAFMPEGRVLMRHLKQQHYLNAGELF